MLNSRLIIVSIGAVTAMVSLVALASAPTSAGVFSPSSLTGLKFWVDSSDASTITSSGGFVSRVTDKSGNGLTLSQDNSTRRPRTSTATLNGLNVFTFDGDDSLASVSLTQALPVTMFAVVRVSDDDGWNRQVIGNTSRHSPVFYKSDSVWRLYAGSELVSQTSVDTNWHYLGGVVNSGSSQLRLDGTSIAQGNTGSLSWDDRPIWIGDSEVGGGGSFGWIGDIAEVLIYSRVLSGAEIAQVESYINTKWFVVPAPTTQPSTTTSTPPTTIPATTPPATPPTTPATSSSTSVAPALEIVVNAPSSSGVSATINPIGQSQIPTISQSAVASGAKSSPTPSIVSTTVPASATSSLPKKTSNVATLEPPVPPEANAGAAAVRVGGRTAQAVVRRADNQLVVTAGSLKAVVGGLNADGTTMALDEAGNVRLKAGSTVRIKLAGFLPESTAEVWLFSTPVMLGAKKVGGDGTVTATFTIPKNAPKGSHRIVVVTRTSDDKSATLSVGIDIGEWKKEATLTVWLIVLPIILAVIGALVLPATRRRRKQRALS